MGIILPHSSPGINSNPGAARPALDCNSRRPPHFPDNPRLDRLITTGFAASLGPFILRLVRRQARDLRKGLFGPFGSREVPTDVFGRRCAGVMTFDLPRGWLLRLSYAAPPPAWEFIASDVLAEFLPPRRVAA
jgi:hypothetical protein